MGSVYISYDGKKGFSTSYEVMQLLSHYLHDELEIEAYDLLTHKEDLIQIFEDTVNGYNGDFYTLSWNHYIIGHDDKNLMIILLQNVISNLQAKGNFISANELKDITTEDNYFKSTFRKQFPVSHLVVILNALIQMLNGTWTFTSLDISISY